MAAPIALRGDYDAKVLRGLARTAGDPGQVRRLLALAAVYDGGPRSAAAVAGLPAGVAIELWWQDEARVGQKNKTPDDAPGAARGP